MIKVELLQLRYNQIHELSILLNYFLKHLTLRPNNKYASNNIAKVHLCLNLIKIRVITLKVKNSIPFLQAETLQLHHCFGNGQVAGSVGTT